LTRRECKLVEKKINIWRRNGSKFVKLAFTDTIGFDIIPAIDSKIHHKGWLQQDLPEYVENHPEE